MEPKGPNKEYARQAIEYLQGATYKGALKVYLAVATDPHLDDGVLAEIGKADRYFLLTQLLRRKDALHPWLYERCREVEADPDNHLDLWAREHYKSTIITFAGCIQEILRDPEITIGIFSHTRPIAKAFLYQIQGELQNNDTLIRLYPDVLWADPRKEAPTWSLDSGIVVRRTGNPKEKTIEAWGLVDGQPVSKHFRLMVYDDVVTLTSVGSPNMILKTTEAWELSRNLSAQNGAESRRTWYIGTRYNLADTYRVMLDRRVAIPRLYPATDDGTPDGKPVLLSPADWDEKKTESSTYVIACQMLQNPIAGSEQEFKPEWLRRWEVRPETLNVAIVVDPANSTKKGSCNTAMAVLGVDSAGNKYLLDGALHKMTLSERWTMLKGLRSKWVRQPGIQTVTVGYERYGMQADIDHFNEMMRLETSFFPIEEVSWVRDGENAKDDRIRRLVPDHQNWRFFYPYDGPATSTMREAESTHRGHLVAKPIKRKNAEGRLYDLVEWFVANEYLFFPATTAKDFLDAMSRIYDLDIQPPVIMSERDVLPEYAGDF